MTSQPLPDVLTVAGFRRWLEGKKPNEVVGYRNDPLSCPLAFYLQGSGLPQAQVGRVAYWTTSDDLGEIPMPDWATEFVLFVDRTDSRLGPITAADALRALEDAEDALAEQIGDAP